MEKKETKGAMTSKTIWFGIVCIAVGVGLAVTELLAQSGTLDAGVISTIAGIFAIILRYKTTVAITLGIDDPTTIEDESKGERPAAKGFARLRALIAVGIVGALMLSIMAGCAGMTVREQNTANASITCGSGLLTTGLMCVPRCLGEATKPLRESCAIDCTVNALQVSAPQCLMAYGDLYSPELRLAIGSAIEAVFEIYYAASK